MHSDSESDDDDDDDYDDDEMLQYQARLYAMFEQISEEVGNSLFPLATGTPLNVLAQRTLT